ncbi:mitogen-activated protein kinase-binding protein 1 [Dorcoceras hygrometricum]|uniref:Mitogen-activated protein kinase-binding protein 1 n=1 Tax=Dorcoceras hygrometricum TaxID=472368 RepID=A0A2Z7A4E1_9LAMI|nr:mitogen-activated protein kinase-binding protein 1 [Dorcoceras hygrometricum]
MLNTLSSVSVRESRIQYLCDPQWFRDTASREPTTIVAPESQFRTCPSDHGNTDSACKNQLVMVSVQYGPFNPYIPIRSTTIGKSRVAIDPIAMHTSWRSNSDIESVTRPVRFGDFRCDQDLRSVIGICCESGLRCYVVLISKSDVVLVSETRVCLEIGFELALADTWGFKLSVDENLEYFRTLYSLSSSPITLDCYCSSEPYFRRLRHFTLPFGARLVALSSSYIWLSIDTSLETGVAGFEEREVVAVFVCLRDCGPVVLLFFNSFGPFHALHDLDIALSDMIDAFIVLFKLRFDLVYFPCFGLPWSVLALAGSSANRCTGMVRATAASARELSMAQHNTVLICQLAPDLVLLATTHQDSKLNSTNYTSGALRAATETPATLNNFLSQDQFRPRNQIAPVLV